MRIIEKIFDSYREEVKMYGSMKLNDAIDSSEFGVDFFGKTALVAEITSWVAIAAGKYLEAHQDDSRKGKFLLGSSRVVWGVGGLIGLGATTMGYLCKGMNDIE